MNVRIEGENAAPGQIAASDVARAILGLQAALAQAATLVAPASRRKGVTGRHTAVVELASRLRLVAISPGSLVTTLALPEGPVDDEDALRLDLETLSSLALAKLLDAVDGSAEAPDVQLARAVVRWAEELGVGERTTRMTVEALDPERGQPARTAIIDGATRARMRQIADARPIGAGDSSISGVLFEADFEKRQARLRVGRVRS